MELMELFAIIRNGEGPRTEFKADFPKQADDIGKEIAALANSGGGVLLIGVEDDGTPKGVHDPCAAMERLAGVARSCSPQLSPEIDKIQLGAEVVIVYVKVPPNPCSYRGKYYVRVGPTCHEASGDEIRGRFPVSAPDRHHSRYHPPPTRCFQGRTGELERLATLLEGETVSIIVIEGISGIGKTALSARFAELIRQRDYLPFWMDCREDTSFDSVASALGVFATENSNPSLAETLEDVTAKPEDRLAGIAADVSGCRYVLFFDDYHLVADPLVNRLLQKVGEHARATKLILICRRRPKIAASISPVLLLEQPLRSGLDPASSRLFLGACGLDVPRDTADKIWKLTGEGHPKALELFAARSRTYPVEQLLSSLPVFREELKNHWLTPLIDELPAEQRDTAVELSVYDRPIRCDAVNWLYPGREVDSLIVGLVDRFILDRMGDNAVGMHPLIREFCYESMPDKRSKHIRAAEYYVAQWGGQLDADLDTDTVDDLQVEAGIAAWSHFMKAEEHVRAEEVLSKLRGPLMDRGQYEQTMFLIEQTPLSPENRDWRVIDKARIFSLWGDYETAVSTISPLTDSPVDGISREAILVLASVFNDHERPGKAKDLLEANRELFMKDTRALVQKRFLYRLVEAHVLMGDLDQALSWASRMVELTDAEGEEVSGAISLRQMASVLLQQGKADIALPLAKISYDLFLKNTRIRDAAIGQMLLAAVHKELGDRESALRHLQESLDAFVNMGDRRNSTICRQRLKELETETGAVDGN